MDKINLFLLNMPMRRSCHRAWGLAMLGHNPGVSKQQWVVCLGRKVFPGLG